MKFLCVASWLAISASLQASNLDTIGVTLLRQVDSTLQGSGVPAAQVEATVSTNMPPPFEVNPGSVGQLTNFFTYISSLGVATGFTNTIGAESWHANGVANNFYGTSTGAAPQIAHVTNYEADFFYKNIIKSLVPNPPAIAAQVVNQSFIFDQITTNDQATIEQNYDNYAAQYGTLFVSGVGNGSTPVSAPATCYNGIGVGDTGGGSSIGPTYDGRCKPDITAPSGATSFSTPYVAGSAAVLIQAGARGDGGTNIAYATDLRTVKALLLNGAITPSDWTNGPSSPLDARYGAGVVNVFNSWEQMRGGEHSFIEASSFSHGSPHPPGSNTNDEPMLTGWDFNNITNSGNIINYQGRVNHYYFSLPSNAGGSFTFTTTLAWNRQEGQSTVNDLNLFLYDAATSNLVACSTSLVDNVEHIYLPALPPGRYDLQVEKNPGVVVTASETYALAFEFFNLKLNIAVTNGNAILTWPIAPTGFSLQSAPSLTSPTSWTAIGATVSVSNVMNTVSLPVTGTKQFFRLQRP